MTLQNDSPAAQVPRAQVKAWSNHHLAVARAAVAGNATLAVTTTQARDLGGQHRGEHNRDRRLHGGPGELRKDCDPDRWSPAASA
jgi:hypothetical protein